MNSPVTLAWPFYGLTANQFSLKGWGVLGVGVGRWGLFSTIKQVKEVSLRIKENLKRALVSSLSILEIFCV